MKSAKLLMICVLVLSGFQAVGAEEEIEEPRSEKEEKEEEVWVLDEVAVTGLRIQRRLKDSPVITEVIDREEIQQTGATDLSDALEAYGLMFTENAMGDYISLRGMGGGRVLFLINGRRVPGRVAQRIQGATLPIGDVERIEIVRGAQSALYGSDGIGGVINVITVKPKNDFSAAVRAAASALPTYRNPDETDNPGFFEAPSLFQEQTLTGNVTFGIGPVSTRITVDGKRSGFYLDEDRERSILPAQLRGKAGAEVDFPLGENSYLNAGGSIFALRTDDQTNSSGGLHRQEVGRYEGYVSSEHFIGGKVSLKTQLYDHYYTRTRNDYSGLTQKWEEPEREAENIVAGELFSTIEFGPRFTMVAGLEASFNTLWREWLVLADAEGVKSRDKEAIVLQGEVHKEDLYSLVFGVRGERDSLFGYMASPRLAGMVYLAPPLRLLAGAGVGYRAPDFNELFLSRNVDAMPFLVTGNPDLRPEYSIGGDIGAEYVIENLFAHLSVYYSELFDEIQYFETEEIDPVSGKPIIETRNIFRSLRTGVDVEARVGFLKYAFVSGGYGFLYAYDRTEGERIRLEPAHTARLKVGLDIPERGLYFHAAGLYFSPEDPSSGSEDYLEHRYQIDLYGSFEIGKHFLGFVSVENLTGYVNRSLGPYYGPKLTLGIETTF
jgi:outer membrane receptor for ferrienterochelin and colicins